MQIYDALMMYKNKGIKLMMVTVVEKVGDGPLEVGKKMLVTEKGDLVGTVGGGAIEYEAIELCKQLITKQESRLEKYLLKEGKVVEDTTTLPMACGGLATLFYEYVGVKAKIYIFGAGHVGQALTRVLEPMNYHITVVDHREDVTSSFVGGNEVICKQFVDYIQEESLEEGSYVVVCTPSHKYDYSVLHKTLELGLKPKYIGMLCSKGKLKDYLSKTYEQFGEDVDLSNFYSPIGLDTGGGSPAEIAVSIAAEILSIQYNKENHKHMRQETYR